jgi:cathepsin D
MILCASQWLLSTECTLDTCSGLDKFDPTSSSTYKNGSTGFSIAYGSGDAQGHLGADTVTLGGFSVQGQTFGVVNTMSAGLVDSPLSGLMGLGFKSLTVTGTTPWWMSLAGTSAWSEPLFGFYMRRYRDVDSAAATEAQGGTLTLGYVDEALYEGDIEYVPVDADKQRYWNIPIKGRSGGFSVIVVGEEAHWVRLS